MSSKTPTRSSAWAIGFNYILPTPACHLIRPTVGLHLGRRHPTSSSPEISGNRRRARRGAADTGRIARNSYPLGVEGPSRAACRARQMRRLRGLPTRQSSPPGGPHPRVELGAVPATSEPRRSRRPCHLCATSSGQERYPADSHGHFVRPLGCARIPDLGWGRRPKTAWHARGQS